MHSLQKSMKINERNYSSRIRSQKGMIKSITSQSMIRPSNTVRTQTANNNSKQKSRNYQNKLVKSNSSLMTNNNKFHVNNNYSFNINNYNGNNIIEINEKPYDESEDFMKLA
jgi:hypothetical protein